MPKKIVSLTSTNVKRLRAVHIEPNGNMVVIGGANAQGKSSVLDSIEMALRGKGAVCERPIRDGADGGVTILNLGEMIVKRTYTKNDSSVQVTTKDGAKYSSPQALLDGLVGQISFDPLGFTRFDSKKQAATLQRVVGLDFSAIDADRGNVFDKRTGVNRQITSVKARLQAMPEYADAPDAETSIDALSARLKEAQGKNADTKQIENVAIEAGRKLDRTIADCTAIEKQIMELQIRLDAGKAELLIATEAAAVAREALEARPPLIDTAPIFDEFSKAEVLNAATRGKLARRKVAEELQIAEELAVDLTNQIAEYDLEKKETLAAAKFPVPGLSFTDDGVTYNGIPFEQCSSAEQLRVSVAMGIAMNPELRVILIRDGSLLDANSLRIIGEMADAGDCQIWVERVSDDGAGCSVVIEDGAVKGAEMPVEEAAAEAPVPIS